MAARCQAGADKSACACRGARPDERADARSGAAGRQPCSAIQLLPATDDCTARRVTRGIIAVLIHCMTLIVKVCGLKSAEAVDAALESGADMVGFVFFPPSPRNVSFDAAQALGARV